MFEKRSRLFTKWIISYVSVFLIPLILLSVYYSHIYQVMKTETIEQQHLSLVNIQSQLDNNFNDLIRISTNLQMNQNVNAIAHKDTEASNLPIYIYDLYNELSIFMVTSSFIEEMYIYFPQNQYIVSSSTAYQRKYTSYMPNRYITEDDWNYLTGTLTRNNYEFYRSNDDSNKLIFSRCLIYNNRSKSPQAIIAFKLNEERLEQTLRGYLASSNFSELAFSSHAVPLVSTNLDLTGQIKEEGGHFYYANEEIGETVDYIVDDVPLSLPGSTLVSYTEEDMYFDELSNMYFILFLLLLFSILIGIILTYTYSVRNYRPLHELIQFIGPNSADVNERNEYQRIKKVIIQSNMEIETQRNLLRNNYLNKLLTGELLYTQMTSTISKQLNISFDKDYFYVITFSYTTADSTANPTIDLTSFIAQNILKELFIPFYSNLYFCNSHNTIAMIINTSNIDASSAKLIEESLSTFITYTKNHFNIDFSAGISDACQNHQLPDAYTQSRNTLEYIHLFDTKGLLFYEETPTESQIGYVDLKTSEYVINLVMSGDEGGIHGYFEHLHQDFSTHKLSAGDAKSCLYFFYNVTMRLKASLSYQYSYKQLSELFVLDPDFFNEPFSEALLYIESMYNKITVMLRETQPNSVDQIIQDVHQYIDSNYFDFNLNLNTIADHFDVTPSYLSKKFRSEYGFSIIDHLYRTRIQHGIMLLHDTRLKIAEIAQMIGFPNSNAFIRIFKKYQGCTPGQYKVEKE